ncbi:MAG: cytochrome c biogenesis protein CcsA [Sulfurovum sp.]|nr:cytochrome c biogenesis protein CcsA [Sulfurovum sp.]
MIYKILSSYGAMLLLFAVLGIGAAVGTFIENDFGSARAKDLVYTAWWYQLTLFLASLNLIAVIYKTKMYRNKTRILFHGAFVIILFGAALTHYFGIEGVMHIREGSKSNIVEAGEHKIEVPFYLKLNDFVLTRYPGSKSPSEFSSTVTVIDQNNNKEFDTMIYMNNTLTYGGYKFFQTSYDDDEKGTKLSVNKDPGVEVTYIGYAMLFLGLLLNLVNKNSRFQFIIRKIKKMPIASIVLSLLLFSIMQTPADAKETTHTSYTEQYLSEHRDKSKKLSESFGAIVVQSVDGRMKPLDTQNREILNKLTSKSRWEGMDANQVILGMFARPELWKNVNIIKVSTPTLRAKLGIAEDQKFAKFTDFFDDNKSYKIGREVEVANKLVPSKRGTFERDLLKVDERLNIIFMSYKGTLLTIFPLIESKQNEWVDFKMMFRTTSDSKIKRSTSRLLDAVYNRNYDKGFKHIEDIKKYQATHGSKVLPENQRLELELLFSKSNLFFRLSLVYLLFGMMLLIYGLASMFYNKLINPKVKAITVAITSVFFLIHTAGLAIRWYIGGFAPLSNTYETMVYIAYSSVLAGIFLLRRSTIGLAASLMMAGIFIFAAYLGEIDPEITNLVPVLKSYWLSIHVSVITASYGFFGVGAILGLVTLLLFILKNDDRPHIDTHIQNITYINEAALILGLVLLVIGNFLGGIWANESWGRYWGWDPKETWAYISIIVYAILLHIRLLKDIYSPYLFATLSVISFFSILMTYYGVNFYLAGMHSYATGDPVPIPTWVYISVGSVLAIIAIAYPKRKQRKTNEKYQTNQS